MADLLAASTADGLDSVCRKILDVAGTHLRPAGSGNMRAYTSQLTVSLQRIERALDTLEALANPMTWHQLEISAPGYPQAGWMGGDLSTLIEILYGFVAPLVEYYQLTYSVHRNLALLDQRTRLHFALLKAAGNSLFDDLGLAAVSPSIAYTPRVPDWRSKRVTNPQRYWWQGLSQERFKAAIPFFLRPSSARPGVDPLISAREFLDVYRGVFRSSWTSRPSSPRPPGSPPRSSAIPSRAFVSCPCSPPSSSSRAIPSP